MIFYLVENFTKNLRYYVVYFFIFLVVNKISQNFYFVSVIPLHLTHESHNRFPFIKKLKHSDIKFLFYFLDLDLHRLVLANLLEELCECRGQIPDTKLTQVEQILVLRILQLRW